MGTRIIPLSETKLAAMVKEVDGQLADLGREQPLTLHAAKPTLKSQPAKPIHRHRGVTAKDAPVQAAIIERETRQPFSAFWKRYLHQAQRDLCLPGGMLHDHWAKWKKLESKATVRVSYGWISAMGFPTHSLQPLTIAASVFLLNAALNIGIKTVCEGCEEREQTRGIEPQRIQQQESI